jgi:DUF1680 family protein
MIKHLALLMALLMPAGLPAQRENKARVQKVQDLLAPAPYGSVKIDGYIGSKLDLCIANRVMAQDVDRLVEPFALRNDGTGGFRSEFWGKWFTSAMLGYGYAPKVQHREVIYRAVSGLMQTATADGYIGTYPDEHHLGDWDIWGRKYVLLGLLAYHDQVKDPKVLEAAGRVADHLILEAGEGSGVNIAGTGWIGWKGLASCSVLEPMALLYQKTGEARYLDFARYIIRSWDAPNRLSPAGLHLIQQSLSGVPLWKTGGAPKAYEMMSCFEGLCEMYRITGERLYLDACRSLIQTVLKDEIMIVGSGSVAEIWCNGKMRQTEPMYQGMETCVTATWMKFLFQMLRLTGDSKYADQLEISLYNAMLAAMAPKGDWWAYYTGLAGERVHSHLQFADVVMSCCVANGPRGLLLTPSWSVMTTGEGIAVNLYGRMEANVKTPGNQSLSLQMNSGYPVEGDVSTVIHLPKKETFTLDFRIPEWSAETVIKINGQVWKGYVIPGTYASVRREWADNDRIEIAMDMRARVVPAPSGLNDAAIMRGPIVLAFDTRLVPFRTGVDVPPMYRYEFLTNAGSDYIDLEPAEPEAPGMWMCFKVPLKDEAGEKHYLTMCDYASAGNTWEEGNLFRVWIQQPFDFRHLYVNNLNWRVNVTEGSDRPVIPEIYRK